jgi:hypothetical protein
MTRVLVLATAFLTAFLAGCAVEPVLPTVVKVPVITPCITEPVKQPIFITDADLLQLDEYGFIVGLARDRLERKKYELALEAALAGCI